MIEGHGDDLYKYNGCIKLNFSSNIYQGANHSELKSHLREKLDCISNYPMPLASEISTQIAQKLSIPAECVLMTNGAAEAIHLIARAYHTMKSTVLQPTFTEYADACRIYRHQVSTIYDINYIPDMSDLVWICNPNNPTGKVLPYQDLKRLIINNPDKIFVVDQAYHAYTHCKLLSATDVLLHNNLILLYSLTKDYAIPGLRIGYIVSNSDVIATLKSYMVPWAVNAIAIEAAKFLLSKSDVYYDLDFLLAERCRISLMLTQLGIITYDSDTNFMLCKLPHGKASVMKDDLAKEHGILIRDASNFEGLSEQHFRIAVQASKANDLLINALRQWLD